MIRRVVALGFILVAVLLAVRLGESLSSAGELRRSLDEARRVRLLVAGTQSVPTAAGAAMRRYAAACALMPQGGAVSFDWFPSLDRLPGLGPGEVTTPDRLAEAAGALEAFGEALELVRRAAETGYEPPAAAPALGLELSRLHEGLVSLVALLRARCHGAASRGDADEALRSCADGLRLLDLGRGLGSLPVEAWRLQALAELASTAGWVASRMHPSVRACRQALGALDRVALFESVEAAIRGEAVADLALHLSDRDRPWSLRGWAEEPWRRRRVAAYLDHMARGFGELARLKGLRDGGRAWGEDARRLGAGFYVDGALNPLVPAAVAVDLGMLAVAGRLAADEGEPAACLDDLSQTLVAPSRRTDPWSGRPYCWGAGPCAAYSVGADGRDDGGDPARDLTLARVR